MTVGDLIRCTICINEFEKGKTGVDGKVDNIAVAFCSSCMGGWKGKPSELEFDSGEKVYFGKNIEELGFL
jgi:hypothetical protein